MQIIIVIIIIDRFWAHLGKRLLINKKGFLGVGRVQLLPFYALESPQRSNLKNGSAYITK